MFSMSGDLTGLCLYILAALMRDPFKIKTLKRTFQPFEEKLCYTLLLKCLRNKS